MAHSSCLTSEQADKFQTTATDKTQNCMKNISPFMSKDLIAAAGFNVEAPIVEAIIGNLTGVLPRKRSDAEMIKCNICDCELTSGIALNIHTNGLRHRKRLKALEIMDQLKEAIGDGLQFRVDKGNPRILRCDICSKTVNSAQQLEIHLSGAKHKKKLYKSGMIRIKSHPLKSNLKSRDGTDSCAGSVRGKKKKCETKITFCDICNIFVNSLTQYHQHLLSKKHVKKAKKTIKLL